MHPNLCSSDLPTNVFFVEYFDTHTAVAILMVPFCILQMQKLLLYIVLVIFELEYTVESKTCL